MCWPFIENKIRIAFAFVILSFRMLQRMYILKLVFFTLFPFCVRKKNTLELLHFLKLFVRHCIPVQSNHILKFWAYWISFWIVAINSLLYSQISRNTFPFSAAFRHLQRQNFKSLVYYLCFNIYLIWYLISSGLHW